MDGYVRRPMIQDCDPYQQAVGNCDADEMFRAWFQGVLNSAG